MKEYTWVMIENLQKIYENLAEFNNGYSQETYQYYKGKAEAVKEIIELVRKTEYD